MNLGKAWWISRSVVPFLDELQDHYDHGHMLDPQMVRNQNAYLSSLVYNNYRLVRNMRALTSMMKKRGLFPPAPEEPLSAQALDPEIWIPYPRLPSDVSTLLCGGASTSAESPERGQGDLSDLIPLHDTERNFSYGRMFVQAALEDEYHDLQHHRMDCILSIMRNTRDWQISIAIATQSGLMGVCVQPDPKQGVSWQDVQWKRSNAQLIIRLPRALGLKLQLRESDYQTLADIYKYTQQVQAKLQPEADETLILEDTLTRFQYLSSDARSTRFPKEPLLRCRLRLFEQTPRQAGAGGVRQVHRGFRLMIITSPKTKTLSHLGHVVGQTEPNIYGLLRDDRANAGLLLKIREPGCQTSNVMTFESPANRDRLLALLRGNSLRRDEVLFTDLPCKGFLLEKKQDAGPNTFGGDVLHDLGFEHIRVIDKKPEAAEHARFGRTILSETLRLCLESKTATLTDRINLGRIDFPFPRELTVWI